MSNCPPHCAHMTANYIFYISFDTLDVYYVDVADFPYLDSLPRDVIF